MHEEVLNTLVSMLDTLFQLWNLILILYTEQRLEIMFCSFCPEGNKVKENEWTEW